MTGRTSALAMAFGAGAGAGIMYLADPDAGRRRRIRMRKATVRASHAVTTMAGAASCQVEHLGELASRTVARVAERKPSAGRGLAGRMRARLGGAKGSWTHLAPAARAIAGVAGLALVALSSGAER